MSKKAAILDSDFTIKMASTRNSQDKSLADVVFELPYTFYCHEQNKIEITDHAQIASAWLERNIAAKKITCITDLQILTIIKNSYNLSQNNAIKFYADWLKKSCDVFSKSFYETHYSELASLACKEEVVSDKAFCDAVLAGDLCVGKSNNLGEIKDTLLAITINQCLQMDCINFCSDDNRARRSLLSFSQNDSFPIKSISYVGFYWVAKQKDLLSKNEEAEYLDSWKKYCSTHKIGTNVTIKKNIHHLLPDYPKIDIDELFKSIWADDVIMMNDGYLVYKEELNLY